MLIWLQESPNGTSHLAEKGFVAVTSWLNMPIHVAHPHGVRQILLAARKMHFRYLTVRPSTAFYS